MIRVVADFNRMEGDRAVALHPEHTPPDALVPGTRVIVYEPGDIECEAIVRRGTRFPWVADMIEETIRYAPETSTVTKRPGC